MSQPIRIQTNRLAVEIAAPGSVYRRTRFDWSAFITQVTLDGRHTFCVPEDYDPAKGTGGIGLCNEFGIEAPIGYDDAQVGESFPKLGIGLLKKDSDAPYNFFRDYEITQEFPMEVAVRGNTATFVVNPVECRGYAARLTKTVRVAANTLEIGYTLENTGSKVIATHEYCHNFVGIDGKPVGPEYRLHFPYPVQFHDDIPALRASAPAELLALPVEELDRRIREYLQVNRSNLKLEGNTLSLHAIPERPFYCRPAGFFATDQPQWELVHADGIEMREFDDFSPVRVAVWGVAHVISAEIFVGIHLRPGQTQRWTRKFEFEARS